MSSIFVYSFLCIYSSKLYVYIFIYYIIYVLYIFICIKNVYLLYLYIQSHMHAHTCMHECTYTSTKTHRYTLYYIKGLRWETGLVFSSSLDAYHHAGSCYPFSLVCPKSTNAAALCPLHSRERSSQKQQEAELPAIETVEFSQSTPAQKNPSENKCWLDGLTEREVS